MSAPDPMPLLSVEGLGKRYRRFRRESLRVLSWFGIDAGGHEDTWVLREVTFSVAAGEAIGIIGRNGAGKSTLLKLITGTVQPSEGRVAVRGRVGAILELGLGFNPEFSGRENAYLAAGLMGHPPEEVDEVIGRIADFAEIGAYFEAPVRTYSSGMQVRLAFSVATAFRPDVLIVDEALSVGDAAFQQKCTRFIADYVASGGALLFVSHDLNAVRTLCRRAIVLDAGRVLAIDAPAAAAQAYLARLMGVEAQQPGARNRFGQAEVRIVDCAMTGADGVPNKVRSGETVRLEVTCEARAAQRTLTCGILLRNRWGQDIFGTNTALHGVEFDVAAGGRYRVEFRFPLHLGPGEYTLTAALHDAGDFLSNVQDWWEESTTIEVLGGADATSVGMCYMPVAPPKVARLG